MLAFLSGLFAICVLAVDAVRCGVYGGVVVPKRLDLRKRLSLHVGPMEVF